MLKGTAYQSRMIKTFGSLITEVGIYKRKEERKKTRKQELDQESDQENKKENKSSTKKAIKKTRKQELDQENDQEKKEKNFLFSCSLSWSSSCFLVFLLSYFSFLDSHLSNLYNHFMTSEMDFYEQLLMNVY